MSAIFRKLLYRRRHWPILLVLTTLAVAGAYKGGWELWAKHHLRIARLASERRDFTRARAHLAMCLEAWPSRAETHFLAARTARRADDYADAELHLDACQQLGGTAADIERERLLLAAQRGDLTDTERYLQSALNGDDPDSLLILEALSQGYMKSYRLADAWSCLDRLLESEPDNLQAHLWRGWVMDHLSRFPAALADYRRAVELDPDNEAARLGLGDVLLLFNRPQEALEHFEYLRQGYPPSAPVLLGVARCRRGMGQMDEARKILDQLLADYPSQGLILSERGKLALQTGQPAEAWLRQAVALLPNDVRTNYALYQCLEQCNKHDEAKVYLARTDRIRLDLRRLHEVMQQMADAPHDLSLRCEAAKLFLGNGEDQEGLRWLTSVLREEPRHRAAHAALVDYYERTGDGARAAHHRELAKAEDRKVTR